MTYTTLIVTIMTATFPLSAFAKDVKGLNCYKLQEEGYKVACPDKPPQTGDAELDKFFAKETDQGQVTADDDAKAAAKADAEENGEDNDGPPGEEY